MRKMEYLVFLGIIYMQEVMDFVQFVDIGRYLNFNDCVGFKFSWVYFDYLDIVSWFIGYYFLWEVLIYVF